jgi:hypothetical protein
MQHVHKSDAERTIQHGEFAKVLTEFASAYSRLCPKAFALLGC